MWRRLVYLGIILLWLIVACFPIVSFVLATRDEIKIGEGIRSGLRVFLIQENDAQGIGIEWSRRLAADPDCSRTTLRYLLWEGGNDDFNTEYCLCYEQANNDSQLIGACQ